MAAKKKEEAMAETRNDALQAENQEGPIAADLVESAPGQAPEIPQAAEEAGNTSEAAETGKPSDAVAKPSDEAANELVEKPACPALESLSVLADRHRIAAWHQAALLRYMGWQDDRMVSDEDYRRALDELGRRRIGGGRK